MKKEKSKPCKCGHKSKGIPITVFDKHEMEKGAIVEFEHTCDKKKAEEIARDHLTESPFYYKELEKMEIKLDKMNDTKKIKLPKVSQSDCPQTLKKLITTVNKKVK